MMQGQQGHSRGHGVSPPSSAIVEGDGTLLHFYEWPNDDFRYNLNADLPDPMESKNLAVAHPEIVEELTRKFDAWVSTLPKEYVKTKDNED